jgi:hypothetical protein
LLVTFALRVDASTEARARGLIVSSTRRLLYNLFVLAVSTASENDRMLLSRVSSLGASGLLVTIDNVEMIERCAWVTVSVYPAEER